MADTTGQMEQVMETEITKMFKIRHPIVLAGMNGVATGKLAAAVSNAGGLGVIGGVGWTPKFLRKEIKELKSLLRDPSLPFGVDLLIPQVGGNARKTNTDYTGGQLPELIDIIIEEKATLFVCAVGVPPRWAVDKLHAAGILVQNMCGHVKHIAKSVDAGVDIVCCQGSEGGGHTGEVATMVLIPQCVDAVRGKKSPLTGRQIPVIAAGGIYDGRGVAAAFSLGAEAVWVGTRFIASEESASPKRHVDAVINGESDHTIRTEIYTGRPMRVLRTEHNFEWETKKKTEMVQLLSEGTIPVYTDERMLKEIALRPLLLGQAIGGVKEVWPAIRIVNEMVLNASQILTRDAQRVKVAKPKFHSSVASLEANIVKGEESSKSKL